MTGESKSEDRRMQREQGDVNTTANRRKYWERNLSPEARRWFEEDARYFLHQSLSTPVLNVLSGARGFTSGTWKASPSSTCTATASIMPASTTRR